MLLFCRTCKSISLLPAPITTRALLARRIEATDRQIDLGPVL
jgi:hypothetical protein